MFCLTKPSSDRPLAGQLLKSDRFIKLSVDGSYLAPGDASLRVLVWLLGAHLAAVPGQLLQKQL